MNQRSLQLDLKLQFPPGFRPAGVIKWARLSSEAPSFVSRPARQGAKGRGVRYESRVNNMLEAQYPQHYIQSPWIQFQDSSSGPRWAQPDGFLIDVEAGRVIVIEVKYNHTELAWFQLFMLYLPLARFLFQGRWTFSCLEIVNWYDPKVKCPTRAIMCKHIEHAFPEELNCHIWNPKNL